MLPLVLIDVDGTLVGVAGAPTDDVWAAAADAVDRGQHLALATARPALGPTWEWARRLDPDGWHLFQNGAAWVHSATEEVRPTPLPAGAAEVVIGAAAERDWVVELYDGRALAVDSDAPLAVDHARLLGIPHRRRTVDALAGPIVRAQIVVPIAEAAAARAVAPEGTVGHSATSPAMPGVAFVSITRAGCTKAAAATGLAEALGHPLDRVAMVGDGNNDAEALAAVGHGIAMGNAEPEARAAARHHVGDVDQGGLVDALALTAGL